MDFAAGEIDSHAMRCDTTSEKGEKDRQTDKLTIIDSCNKLDTGDTHIIFFEYLTLTAVCVSVSGRADCRRAQWV